MRLHPAEWIRESAGYMKEKNKTGNWLLNAVYPRRCPICDGLLSREELYLCRNCVEKIHPILGARCKKCGKPVGDEQTEYCRDCRERIEDGNCWFDRGRSLWTHRPPVSGSIYQFKFKNRRVYARYYAETMKERLGKQIQKWKVQAILPVPMDKWKKRKRGYNQAEILAEELGKLTGIHDIYTTGNTVNEAAKTLKKSGVRRVFFLTISIGQDI